MITETKLIEIISGSIIGDYPSVIDDGQDTVIAIELFKKILDIDDDGSINSSLFNITNNSQNPSVIADYQLEKIDNAAELLDSLINVVLPETVKKLPQILNPESLPTLTQTEVNAFIDYRNKLSNVLNSMANVPIVFSEFIT